MLEEKDRIDVVLVKKHYFQTRQKAKYEIEQGRTNTKICKQRRTKIRKGH